MCLTAGAFGLLLSMMSLSNLTVDDGRIVIHLPDGDVHWLAQGGAWCTGAPGTEQLA